MSKTALFFPGQSSQYIGMGKSLYDDSSKVRELYQLASDLIGEDLAKLSHNGPAEKLTQTRFTQPAILVHSLAVLTYMKETSIDFDFAAGHSLGEFGALAVTGALSFEDAIKAVVKRASLMEKACILNPGTMAAIIGLSIEKLNQVCEKASAKGIVVAANFNNKSQIVISGSRPAVEEAVVAARDAGARKAIMIDVGGAFHSPLMQPARDELASFLNELSFSKSQLPVVVNVTGKPESEPEVFRKLLIEQITAPVRWSETMSYLVKSGVSRTIEIGPGKVLTSFAKREMKPNEMISLDTLVDVNSYMKAVA